MERKAREGTVRRSAPTLAYTYARVESALATVFDVQDLQETSFRARLKHFRKLGIPTETPGKGGRLQYSPADIFQLLICLQLAQVGIDPTLIVKIVQRHWALKDGFFAAIQQAQLAPSDDCIAVLRVQFMASGLGQRLLKSTPTGLSIRSAPNQVDIQFVWANGANLIEALAEDPQAPLCVFNLSALIRKVAQALAKK